MGGQIDIRECLWDAYKPFGDAYGTSGALSLAIPTHSRKFPGLVDIGVEVRGAAHVPCVVSKVLRLPTHPSSPGQGRYEIRAKNVGATGEIQTKNRDCKK